MIDQLFKYHAAIRNGTITWEGFYQFEVEWARTHPIAPIDTFPFRLWLKSPLIDSDDK